MNEWLMVGILVVMLVAVFCGLLYVSGEKFDDE